jgi:hypothetical protein
LEFDGSHDSAESPVMHSFRARKLAARKNRQLGHHPIDPRADRVGTSHSLRPISEWQASSADEGARIRRRFAIEDSTATLTLGPRAAKPVSHSAERRSRRGQPHRQAPFVTGRPCVAGRFIVAILFSMKPH